MLLLSVMLCAWYHVGAQAVSAGRETEADSMVVVLYHDGQMPDSLPPAGPAAESLSISVPGDSTTTVTDDSLTDTIPSERTQVVGYVPLDSAAIDSLLPEFRQPEPYTGPISQLFGRHNKFLTYLDRLVTGNVDRTFEKKLDVSYIVMPSYTREGSFGIGGGATGLYRLDKTDSVMQPSDITLIANGTINGLFSLTTNGNIHFPGRKLRYTYKLEYAYSPLNFWGVSYEACATNKTINYTRNQLKFNSELVYNIRGPFYVGAALDVVYSRISELSDYSYLEGQRDKYTFTSVGLTFQYDTRDFILNPKRGMYLMLKGLVRPKFLGSYDRTLFSANLVYNYYLGLWKGGMLAFDVYASYNSTHSPWPVREALGSGGIRMRGYYGGRYIDNNMVSAQVELRQHIFSRLGFAAWIGGGTVIHDYRHFKIRNVLPNYGIGLRIEMKHNVNGRIDWGFGKGTGGFVFSIGEAF